jgi:hypothetical protein
MRQDEPFDVQAAWMSKELVNADRQTLIVVGAALEGYCSPTCPKKFAVAKPILAAPSV